MSGTNDAIPAEQRGYVRAMRAERDAGRKIDRYTEALPTILGRLAPLLRVLPCAAPADPDLAAVWRQIAERRAHNMRRFAAELAATGRLREDLSIEEAADVIW